MSFLSFYFVKEIILDFTSIPEVSSHNYSGNTKQAHNALLISTSYCMQVTQTFAEMIFKHGFVHCDPHAANLLVRPLPSERGTFGKDCTLYLHENENFSGGYTSIGHFTAQ